jgi:hypothetical protein
MTRPADGHLHRGGHPQLGVHVGRLMAHCDGHSSLAGPAWRAGVCGIRRGQHAGALDEDGDADAPSNNGGTALDFRGLRLPDRSYEDLCHAWDSLGISVLRIVERRLNGTDLGSHVDRRAGSSIRDHDVNSFRSVLVRVEGPAETWSVSMLIISEVA